MYFLLYSFLLAAYNEGMSLRNKKVAEGKTYQYHLPCESKRFFDSEAKALDAADAQMLENMNITLGVYRCNICQLWHLTRISSKA